MKYCTKAGIPPPLAKPSKPAAQSPPPTTCAHWPSLPKAPPASVLHRSPPTGPLTVSVSTAGKPVSHAASSTSPTSSCCGSCLLSLPCGCPYGTSYWGRVRTPWTWPSEKCPEPVRPPLLLSLTLFLTLWRSPLRHDRMPPLTLQSAPPPLHTSAPPFILRLVPTLTFLWPLLLLSNPSSTTCSRKSFVFFLTSVSSSR